MLVNRPTNRFSIALLVDAVAPLRTADSGGAKITRIDCHGGINFKGDRDRDENRDGGLVREDREDGRARLIRIQKSRCGAGPAGRVLSSRLADRHYLLRRNATDGLRYRSEIGRCTPTAIRRGIFHPVCARRDTPLPFSSVSRGPLPEEKGRAETERARGEPQINCLSTVCLESPPRESHFPRGQFVLR